MLSAGYRDSLLSRPPSSSELKLALIDALSTAKDDSVRILGLAPLEDLTDALTEQPKLVTKIREVIFSGGWVIGKSGEARATYNINMERVTRKNHSMTDLISLLGQKMRWINYEAVKTMWPSRSINPETAPAFWTAYQELIDRRNSLQQEVENSRAWDSHVLGHLQGLGLTSLHPLFSAITRFAGRQFSPSDPLTLFLMLHPNAGTFVETQVRLDTNDVDASSGIRVHLGVGNGKVRPIEVLLSFDRLKFLDFLQTSVKSLDQVYAQSGLNRQGAPHNDCHAVWDET